MRTGIYLSEIINAFSLMLDIAEKSSFQHSRRTALISCLLGKAMGVDSGTHSRIFYGALLHDIGFAGSLDFYTMKGFHMDPVLVKQHSAFGAELVQMLPFDRKITHIVKCHHERWDGFGPYGYRGKEIPLESQIIALADHLETNYDPKKSSAAYRNGICKWISDNANAAFAPHVVKAFLAISSRDQFWIEISVDDPTLLLRDYYPRMRKVLSLDDLESIAACFARVVDSKSPFTHEHSRCVAELTKHCAQRFGFDALTARKLAIAGYLHDLGKLAVPTAILEKPGALSEDEWEIVKAHPYYTGLILRQIKGFEDIAHWASNHHERLNGTGYVRGLSHVEITCHDQIIAMADMYHALRENRSYRKALSHDEASRILRDTAKNGGLTIKYVEQFIKSIEESAIIHTYCSQDGCKKHASA